MTHKGCAPLKWTYTTDMHSRKAAKGVEMSAVWNYFKVNDSDKSKANCQLCPSKISRGATNSSAYNTSNLIKLLKNQHADEFREFVNSGK